MAIPSGKLAKSPSGMPPRGTVGPAAVRLLFWSWADSASPRTSGWHRHAHWQLERVLTGPFSVHTEDRHLALRTNDVLLIPPGVPHDFRYPARGLVRWLTVRFVLPTPLDGLSPIVLGPDAVVDRIARVLSDLLRPVRRRVSARAWAMAEHCLAGLLSYGYTPPGIRSERVEGPPLVQWVRLYVEENAHKRVTLKEMAGKMGYSPSYVASEYRRHTGGSIKAAIDHARANGARHLILFSGRTVTEVSAALGFPDVYSFSRFFRRMFGLSPRAYRRAERDRPQ
ncbi:MAG: helix-turn-helix transcriptional regulator [Kiritimatiellae bacterium]|nr:helix-turn-helix transcriptional regulator [Kiritimatiellia bacterium]